MALYAGTSGWAYTEWRGAFYPAGLAQSRFLEHYSERLGACEVNATFYRLQSESTFARWAGVVPDRFRFTVKAHRRLTYRKQVAPDPGTAAFAKEFLESLAPLESRLGCVLLQFPPFVERDDDGLERLLDLLPGRLAFACEFQNESWWKPAVAEALATRGGTFSIRESDGSPPAALPPGPLAYVRLKGEHYAPEARLALLAKLEEEAAERDVYVFARHKDVAAGDPHTGVGLAEWLSAGGSTP